MTKRYISNIIDRKKVIFESYDRYFLFFSENTFFIEMLHFFKQCPLNKYRYQLNKFLLEKNIILY